ncbi:MAG: DUF1214 domain-containing protein [Pseudomonadota bacterium]
MKLALFILSAILLIGGAVWSARALTIAALTDQNAIYDDFEQTPSLWLFSDKIGAAAASGVERAKVAIAGPLGLSSKEVVYLIALTDNQGERLVSNCTYRVTGSPIDTRWWSLTLYDSETQHYVPNEDNRSSWNSVAIPRDQQGNWSIDVAPTRRGDAWLPSQSNGARAFELMLRVYSPSAATRAALPDINLPDVARLSC